MLTTRDSLLLTRVFERLAWVNRGVAEAHELGNAPGQGPEPWTERSVRSVVNVYRLTLPAPLITRWARNAGAASVLMQQHRVEVSHENQLAWDRANQSLANFALVVRDLPETDPWPGDSSLELLDAGPGSVVVRFDLLANLFDPRGIAELQAAYQGCISWCQSRGLETSPPLAFDYEEQLSNHGLRVLFALWLLGDTELGQIAALTSVTLSTTKALVDSLALADFVQGPSADDRFKLSKQGTALVEMSNRAEGLRPAGPSGALDLPELAELGRLLRKVQSSAERKQA